MDTLTITNRTRRAFALPRYTDPETRAPLVVAIEPGATSPPLPRWYTEELMREPTWQSRLHPTSDGTAEIREETGEDRRARAQDEQHRARLAAREQKEAATAAQAEGTEAHATRGHRRAR
jgi:hypothetical protein